MKTIQQLSPQQASTIIGGYRSYASKSGCESREGVGNCFKDNKDGGKWKNDGGAFSK